jgi:hypothetical protein
MQDNSKHTGDCSVLMIKARLALKKYVVLEPYGDNQRYDLVIENDGKFERVQCKTGVFKNNRVSFSLRSIFISKKKPVVRTYHGQIEYFGVFCKELDKCYLVPISKTGRNAFTMCIRPEDIRNNRGHYAKDYEI